MDKEINERWARLTVSEYLNLPVDRYDDGSEDGMLDAIIHLPDEDVFMEVTSDTNTIFMNQHATLKVQNQCHQVPGIANAWTVSLDQTHKIAEFKKAFRQVMPALEQDLVDRRASDRRTPLALQEIGVEHINRDRNAEAGTIWIITGELESVSVPMRERTQWISQYVIGLANKRKKLARAPGSQRHLFLWMTHNSPYSITSELENRPTAELPSQDLELPPEVTHLWVGGYYPYQGVIAWFPDNMGWRWIRRSRVESEQEALPPYTAA